MFKVIVMSYSIKGIIESGASDSDRQKMAVKLAAAIVLATPISLSEPL